VRELILLNEEFLQTNAFYKQYDLTFSSPNTILTLDVSAEGKSLSLYAAVDARIFWLEHKPGRGGY
jgi:hypothetical protein